MSAALQESPWAPKTDKPAQRIDAHAPHMRRAKDAAHGRPYLRVRFQPIAELQNIKLMGHQATPLLNPQMPTGTERREHPASQTNRTTRVDSVWAPKACRQWMQYGGHGHLFINLRALHVVKYAQTHGTSGIHDLLRNLGLPAGQLVVNLCAYEGMPHLGTLLGVKRALHENGVLVSLGESSQGRPDLLAWEALQPDFAWMPGASFKATPTRPHKIPTVGALKQLGAALGIRLIANAIDTLDEFRVLRDIGIELGQGQLFGLPSIDPVSLLPPGSLSGAMARPTDMAPPHFCATGNPEPEM